ncbi:hypothetical protein SDC9_50219 [bioreactor metagenome]|uniref:HNH nuclease domain-containing protein n=1 Tax=bioreactor metagenome TaxID=1076179 RepID=A0A644WJH9_9ZZZZ
MRRILIDKKIESFAKDYGKNPFIKRISSFIKPIENLTNLKEKLIGYPQHQLYIDKIIAEYSELNCLKPMQFDRKKQEFDNILPSKDLNTRINLTENDENGKSSTVNPFYEMIVEAMRYEDLREKDFLIVLVKLEMKSCIYCNSQLTIVTDKNDTNTRSYARLELDHYYPKSIYPFLCTNFYNLYPVCGNCNRIKSTRDAKFALYTEDKNNIEAFKFCLKKSSVAKYLTNRKIEDIEFQFLPHPNSINDIAADHDEMFCIQGIYNTQKDIIEELIHKKEVYTEAYQEDLIEQFQNLFPDKAVINRLLIGNYDKPEEIHKRPMAKFIQDIASDLKLI